MLKHAQALFFSGNYHRKSYGWLRHDVTKGAALLKSPSPASGSYMAALVLDTTPSRLLFTMTFYGFDEHMNCPL